MWSSSQQYIFLKDNTDINVQQGAEEKWIGGESTTDVIGQELIRAWTRVVVMGLKMKGLI